MLTNLYIRTQSGLAVLVQMIVALYAPVRAAKRESALTRPRLVRGAEFIEVALYAAIIVTIAWFFRAQLQGAFANILQDIRDALGVTR